MNKIKMIDSSGKSAESIDLGFDLSGCKINPRAYSCAIRVLLQNWRQGTVGCKSRGQVAFANKKPWKQKGTGRARAGSARSPLWRKGGVTFGPTPRTKTLKLTGSQRKLALGGLLKSMDEKNSIFCLDNNFEAPSTKQAFGLLKSMGVEKQKGILFLPYDDVNNYAAFRNIPYVGVFSFDQPNVFDLSGAAYWMFLKKDLSLFKDMVSRWM